MLNKLITGIIVVFLLSFSISCSKPSPVSPTGATTLPGSNSTIPRPTPRPPQIPFEVHVVPDNAHYLPGKPVEATFAISNTSSSLITISPYPPEIQVTPGFDYEHILFSQGGGLQEQAIKPGDTATVDFSWDQKDKTGNQVLPGWYNVMSKQITVKQGTSTTTFTPGTRLLIEYPQGATVKSFDPNQSQTAVGLTVTLEHIDLTADSSAFYFFFIPPGYTPPSSQPGAPPMPPPPGAFTSAQAEYTIEGVTKTAGGVGFNTKGDGIKLVWGTGPGNLDPVPTDAKEISFTIIQLNGINGPWLFKVPLE